MLYCTFVPILRIRLVMENRGTLVIVLAFLVAQNPLVIIRLRIAAIV